MCVCIVPALRVSNDYVALCIEPSRLEIQYRQSAYTPLRYYSHYPPKIRAQCLRRCVLIRQMMRQTMVDNGSNY